MASALLGQNQRMAKVILHPPDVRDDEARFGARQIISIPKNHPLQFRKRSAGIVVFRL